MIITITIFHLIKYINKFLCKTFSNNAVLVLIIIQFSTSVSTRVARIKELSARLALGIIELTRKM